MTKIEVPLTRLTVQEHIKGTTVKHLDALYADVESARRGGVQWLLDNYRMSTRLDDPGGVWLMTNFLRFVKAGNNSGALDFWNRHNRKLRVLCVFPKIETKRTENFNIPVELQALTTK